MKRLLTGLQPSGSLHIGNYFGAIKPFLDEYQTSESFLMVVDYHALTTMREGDVLRKNIIDVVKDYLALGVDPERATIFKQSDIHEHTELAWIFECLVSVPFLMQSHAYKDKIAKGLEPNAGLFNYPMLMAADILLYDSDVVPVGEDQRQHLEYTREVVTKFNNAYGETFKAPQELIYPNVGVIPGTDGQKMSKSYGNTIPLFGSHEEIEKAVMSIVTDSEGGVPQNVYALHKRFRSERELEVLYKEYEGNYKVLKEKLVEDIDAFIKPLRERRAEIRDEEVKAILQKGGEYAQKITGEKMKLVRQRVGVTL